MAYKGRLILLKISDGTSPGVFSTFGGIRSRTITVNNETVDITDSDNAPFRQLLGDTGMRSMSISGSGIFKDDTGINAVEDLALTGNLQEFQVCFPNGDIVQGLFAVASFEYSGDYNSNQNFSVTLESASIFTMMRAA